MGLLLALILVALALSLGAMCTAAEANKRAATFTMNEQADRAVAEIEAKLKRNRK